jgi:predicted Mrr-cat superfamily restriction endonuclease
MTEWIITARICNLPRQKQRAKTGYQPTFVRQVNSPMDKKFSKHQQRIIKNYYENREAISLQRLSELVTELYLAEGKARERQWKYIITALEKLGLPEARIEHLRKKDDPKLLAKLVEELMSKQK